MKDLPHFCLWYLQLIKAQYIRNITLLWSQLFSSQLLALNCHLSPQECELFQPESELEAPECEVKTTSNYTWPSQLWIQAVNTGIYWDLIAIKSFFLGDSRPNKWASGGLSSEVIEPDSHSLAITWQSNRKKLTSWLIKLIFSLDFFLNFIMIRPSSMRYSQLLADMRQA